MTINRRLIATIVCVFALLANTLAVAAQEAQERRRPTAVTVQGEGAPRVWVGGNPGQMAVAPQGENTFVFVSSEMSIDGKVVKGAPYSAQATNESVQTLAGGNRIVRQNTSMIYRDSQGRTRREQTISVVGGFSAQGKPAQTTFINDPVAGVNYILDTENKTARKVDYAAKIAAEKDMVAMKKRRAADAAPPSEDKAAVDKTVVEKMAIEKAAAASGGFTFEMRTGPGGGPPVMAGKGPVMMMGNKQNTKKEELGKQTIEGVEAEGTRYVTTLAAGEIGNELPIEMVFETWFSPELQTVVMSKHSDPRFGENTYRLTNINRSEPAHSLFEVPSDFTIQEAGPPPEMRYKIERELQRRPSTNQ